MEELKRKKISGIAGTIGIAVLFFIGFILTLSQVRFNIDGIAETLALFGILLMVLTCLALGYLVGTEARSSIALKGKVSARRY